MASTAAIAPARSPAALSSDTPRDAHAAFFAAARLQIDALVPEKNVPVVRTSLLAAILASTVVACGFVGLDVSGYGEAFRPIADLLPDHPNTRMLMPVMIVLGLFGGGKAAGTSLLLTHSVLKRFGRTNPIAYAIAGVASAKIVAAAMVLVLGKPSAHGFALDLLAGGAGGFFYRMFAGVSSVSRSR